MAPPSGVRAARGQMSHCVLRCIARGANENLMQRRTLISALGAVTLARSHPATAQQVGTTVRIGLLTINSIDAERRASFDALRQSLNDLGYIPGPDIVFEHRSADSRNERVPALARGLGALKVNLIHARARPGRPADRQ